jgi:hypothetical protein
MQFWGAGVNIISRLIHVRKWADCATKFSLIMIFVFAQQITASYICHTISHKQTPCIQVSNLVSFALLNSRLHFHALLKFLTKHHVLYFAPRSMPSPPVQVLSLCHASSYLLLNCIPGTMSLGWTFWSTRPSDCRSAPGPLSRPQAAARSTYTQARSACRSESFIGSNVILLPCDIPLPCYTLAARHQT